jgi:hypothetical protein
MNDPPCIFRKIFRQQDPGVPQTAKVASVTIKAALYRSDKSRLDIICFLVNISGLLLD